MVLFCCLTSGPKNFLERPTYIHIQTYMQRISLYATCIYIVYTVYIYIYTCVKIEMQIETRDKKRYRYKYRYTRIR